MRVDDFISLIVQNVRIVIPSAKENNRLSALGATSKKKEGIFWDFFPNVGPPHSLPFWEKFSKIAFVFLVSVTEGCLLENFRVF